MRNLRAFCVGVYNAADVFGRQLVVIRDLDALIRRVNEKLSLLPFFITRMQVAIGVPKKRLAGS